MSLEFGCTERGNRTLLFRGYEYWKCRTNKCGTTIWRCSKRETMKCRARVTTSGSRIVGQRQPEHTHESNNSTSLARKAFAAMKTKVTDISTTPSSAQTSVLSQLPDHVLTALPDRSVVTRTLQKHRKKIRGTDSAGNTIPAAPRDLNFEMPEQYRDLILFDSGPADDRIIIL
jgi:hypothetical protein